MQVDFAQQLSEKMVSSDHMSMSNSYKQFQLPNQDLAQWQDIGRGKGTDEFIQLKNLGQNQLNINSLGSLHDKEILVDKSTKRAQPYDNSQFETVNKASLDKQSQEKTSFEQIERIEDTSEMDTDGMVNTLKRGDVRTSNILEVNQQHNETQVADSV